MTTINASNYKLILCMVEMYEVDYIYINEYKNCVFKYLGWVNYQMNKYVCLAKQKCWFVFV